MGIFTTTTFLPIGRAVAPSFCDQLQPRRVVDVGCGRGGWLRAFKECGVAFIRGLDGDYVGPDTLLIPLSSFTAPELEHLSDLQGSYDVAIFLEVLEHLSPRSGANVVNALTAAAPIVVFSAAIPGQGGTGHINEHWPEYWRELFARRGFRLFDPIRPLVREDYRIKFWYRQNIVMFASDQAIAVNEKLAKEAERSPHPNLEWVHVSIVRKDRSAKALMARISHAFPARLTRHIKDPIKEAIQWGHGH
jgi:SAM-dependent methyltransferase